MFCILHSLEKFAHKKTPSDTRKTPNDMRYRLWNRKTHSHPQHTKELFDNILGHAGGDENDIIRYDWWINGFAGENRSHVDRDGFCFCSTTPTENSDITAFCLANVCTTSSRECLGKGIGTIQRIRAGLPYRSVHKKHTRFRHINYIPVLDRKIK